MSELKTMYPAQPNSPETSLSGAVTATGTILTVTDGAVLPDAPNYLTIGANSSSAETVLMTARDGNTITVERAQDGTTARAWSAGESIGRYFTAADYEAIKSNIETLNKDKAEKVSGATAGNFAALDENGNLKDSGKKAGDFAAAKHTHDAADVKYTDDSGGTLYRLGIEGGKLYIMEVTA